MPELPDVEIFTRYFIETSLNQTIKKVDIESPKMVKGIKPSTLIDALTGKKFITAKRHGKYFFAEILNGAFLVLHFGMTGEFNYFKGIDNRPKHTRMLISFADDKHIAYVNQRKFGLISYTKSMEDYIALKKLGPDPFRNNLTSKDFAAIFSSKTGMVKPALMDQGNISGIGNIYADEALYQAEIHPERKLENFSESELKALYKIIIKILRKGIGTEADITKFPKKWLVHHRKKGESCPLCNGKIVMKSIGGRSSYFCTEHQKK